MLYFHSIPSHPPRTNNTLRVCFLIKNRCCCCVIAHKTAFHLKITHLLVCYQQKIRAVGLLTSKNNTARWYFTKKYAAAVAQHASSTSKNRCTTNKNNQQMMDNHQEIQLQEVFYTKNTSPISGWHKKHSISSKNMLCVGQELTQNRPFWSKFS